MVGNRTCSRSPRPRLLFATSNWKLGFLRHWKPRAWGMGGERMVVSWDAKLGCLGAWRKDGSLSTENALSLCLEPGIFGAELGSGANRLRHLTMPIHSSPGVAKSEGHDIAWEFGSCFGVITVSIHKGKAWCQDWRLLYLAAALVSCIHAFSFALSQHTPRPTGEIEWDIGNSFQHLSNKAIWWGVQLFWGVGLHQYPQVGFLLDQPAQGGPKVGPWVEGFIADDLPSNLHAMITKQRGFQKRKGLTFSEDTTLNRFFCCCW